MPKQTLITDFYPMKPTTVKKIGYCDKTECWHCITCGENMGKDNPRQLCGKYYCQNMYYS